MRAKNRRKVHLPQHSTRIQDEGKCGNTRGSYGIPLRIGLGRAFRTGSRCLLGGVFVSTQVSFTFPYRLTDLWTNSSSPVRSSSPSCQRNATAELLQQTQARKQRRPRYPQPSVLSVARQHHLPTTFIQTPFELYLKPTTEIIQRLLDTTVEVDSLCPSNAATLCHPP